MSAILCSSSKIVSAEHSVEVYVYDFPESQSLVKIRSYFNGLHEIKLTIYYLNDSYYLNESLKIANLLIVGGASFLPSNFCTPCEMAQGLKWQDLYIRYAFPLLLLFQDEKLKAIIISRRDSATLDQALNYSEDDVKVFLPDGSTASLSDSSRMRIEDLYRERVKLQADVLQILPLIIVAAFLDSVNPCEFFVLIVFLSLIIMRLGRMAVLKFGIAYSLAIFIIYFMMGLGVWKLIGYLREARILVVVLGFSIGLKSVLNFIFGFFGLSVGLREFIRSFLNRKFKRVPDFLSKSLAGRLRKFSDNPLSAFVIGVITSAFLLPCTSGPYLLALSLIADLETQIQGVLLLILYNGIIITPLLAISVSIYLLKLETSKLKRWSSTKQKSLNLAYGLILIALSIYLIIHVS